MISPDPCNYEDCDRLSRARGMCHKHWAAWRRNNGPVCAGPECSKVAISARGLCPAHEWQVKHRKDGRLTVLNERSQRDCGVDGCDRISGFQRFCRKHNYRFKRHGDPLTVLRSPKGAGAIDKSGYRQVTIDGKAMMEHRSVMQEHIGRPLLRAESVHHMNGVRHDNRIENLELWSSSHPPGQRVVDKVDWAVSMLELYAPHLLSGDLV